MVVSNVQIYTVEDKAYLPTLASVPIGWFTTGPVIVCQLDLIEVCQSIDSLMKTGHPVLKASEFAIRRKERSPLLQATKKRSWKQLAQSSNSYSLVWTEDETILHFKRQDGKRGAWDTYKTEDFPVQTSIESIVQRILDDVTSIRKAN